MHPGQQNRELPPLLRHLARDGRWLSASLNSKKGVRDLTAPLSCCSWDTPRALAGTETCCCSQGRTSFLCDSHKDPYAARLLPLQTSCLHHLASKEIMRAPYHLTPPTAQAPAKEQDLQDKAPCFPLLINRITIPGPQPGEGGLLSVSRATQKSSDQVRVSAP